MKIQITSAAAEGPTELAAFDTALIRSGIANHNLIYLSSIIPPDSELVKSKPNINSIHFGDRLYVVMSEQRTSKPKEEAWAGIGWVQNYQGAGLFVEHHGITEKQVRSDIKSTLNKMISNRPKDSWSNIQMEVVGLRCEKEPVCALVAAVYKSEPW